MFDNNLVCGICGGIINPDESKTTGTCMGCGHISAYPKADVKILNRITYLRNNYRFDEAQKLATELTVKHAEDSEAFWALLLCEYGIQYVRNGSLRFPVCRKDVSELVSLKESNSYKKAISYATEDNLRNYEDLSSALEDSINVSLNIMKQQKEYDVFILSPENSTVDSDFDGDKIYLRFTANLGFSAFFGPECLKDMDPVEKAAQTLFALKHSKLLIAPFRTTSDTYNGYLNYSVDIFSEDIDEKNKKQMFPAFNSRELNFQQLPEKLVWCDDVFDVSQDDFMRELSEKIETILKPEVASIVPDDIVTATVANKENLIKRAYMFLEDGEFETADSYFDKILDIDIEESRAYIGKLLAECRIRSEEDIKKLPQTVTDDKNFKKALRFATPEQKAHYEELNNALIRRIEEERREVAEQRARLQAEREEKEAIERARRARQEKEERKMQYQRRLDPLRNTLREVQSELNKTFLTPKRRAELKDQEETLNRNIKDLQEQFKDVFD